MLALWQAIGVRQDAVQEMTNLLRRMGLIAIVEHTPCGRGWMMPTRLPREDDILQKLIKKHGPSAGAASAAAAVRERMAPWRQALEASRDVEVLRVTVPVGSMLPVGGFERLVVACSSIGSYVKWWSGGALLQLHPGPKDEGGLQGFKSTQHFLLQLSSRQDASTAVMEHEVLIESCAEKDMRHSAWANVVEIQRLFKAILDEFRTLPPAPGPATLCCPVCIGKMTADASYRATQWPLESVLATSQRCEACNEKVALSQAPLLEESAPPTSLLAHEAILAARARSSAADVVFSVDELRYGRPLEVVSSLAKLLGLPPERIDQLRAEGEAAIIAEFEEEAERPSAWTKEEMGVYAWSELDWCLYLSASKAETVAKLVDDDERARAERSAVLLQQAKADGLIDAEHKDMTIEFWLKRPQIATAGLTRAHVLALRLIASPVAAKINRALRNGCDASKPHPYPATLIWLYEGLLKLWSAQLEARVAASKAAAVATEELRVAKLAGDGEAIAAAEGASKQATADSELVMIGTLWQGVCGLSADAFKERGGTEVGFHRSCSSRDAAQAHAVQQLQSLLSAQARSGARSESELKATFACFDTDGSGSIDLDELQQALGRFGKAVSKEEVEKIVRAVDQNSDGEIDFEEFKAIFKLINASPAPAPEPEPEAAAHSKANGSEDGSAETAGASGDEGGTEGYTEVAQIADGAEDQKKDEVVPLALPSPVDILTDVLGGSDVAAASYARLKATTTATEERPVLLLKIEASLNLASPVNLSFLSPTSSDIFCLPPGAYFEQRKAAIESIPFGSQGEQLEVKIVDVVMHLPPAMAKQAASLADARVEGKNARERAQ